MLEFHELAISDDVFDWVVAEVGDLRAGAAIEDAHDMDMVRVMEWEMKIFHEDLPGTCWSSNREVMAEVLQGAGLSFLWDWP